MLTPALFQEDPANASHVDGSGLVLKTRLAELERELIERALALAEGNHSEAARLLGVTRNGLTMKMRRLDIDPSVFDD
jgi:DNA-binding NtrC family response regulator